MKNKFKKLVIILLFLLLSFVLEIFVFNFKYFSLSSSDKGIFKLNNYDIIQKDDRVLIDVNIENKYINKLIVNYTTKEDIDINIKYNKYIEYNNVQEFSFSDKLDNEVNQEITNINSKVKSLTLDYANSDNLKINSIIIDNNFTINYLRIFFAFSVLCLIYFIYRFYKNGANNDLLYKYFILFGFIIGLNLIILQPSTTYYSWDDQIHFSNTLEIIGGDIKWNVAESNMVAFSPIGRGSINSLEEQINQIHYLNGGINDSGFTTSSSNFIPYNKIVYIPMAIGYYFCKFVGLPFIICFKFGKFMNLIVYLLLMGYAIKLSNYGKRLLTVIGLIPTNIFLATQYSYDPTVTAGITLSLVCIFNLFFDKDSKVDFKTILIIIISMLIGTFPKAIYIPILLLLLFVPNNKFLSKKNSLYVKGGIVIICLLMLYTFVFPTVSSDNVAGDIRGGNTSVSEQLRLIIKYPIDYLNVLKNTALASFSDKTFNNDLIGNYSYINKISTNLYYLFFIFLIFVGITDIEDNNLSFLKRVIILVFIVGIIILIWTALYLSFTPVGLNYINGVQARYFIPLLFPLILCFQTNRIKNEIDTKIYNCLVFGIPIYVLIVSIYQTILVSYCM